MEMRPLSGIFGAASFVDLRAAVAANVLRLGFRYFLFCGCFSAAFCGEPDVCFGNCPKDWSAHYLRLDRGTNRTPLDWLDRDTVTPTPWRQLSARAPELLVAAQNCGLVTGSTHPVHGPDGAWSVLSFIKDRGGSQAEAEVEAALAQCHLLAGYVHEASARLARTHLADLPHLNERECQVLACAASGMTASQIARVLPISERTVIFHLANARRKLGAANSSHAISMALTLGLIRPREFGSPVRARALRGSAPAHLFRET